MNWQLLLLFLTCHTLIDAVENKEVVAQINTKRLIHYVPDRFLSMTIDPTALFLAGNLEQKALKMARGLYPSFVRLGGKATNYLKFGKELLVDNNTITEDQWDGVNNFVEDAGLDLIVSLNPTHRVQGVWDSRDALQLISYSDKHGYNVAWQLGYDTQGHLATGGEVGRDIIRLRKILDGFQRYATTPLFGPDLPDVYTLKESAFIKDILIQAGPVLGAILVQMPFNNENPEQKISNILFNMESHIWSREIRYGRMIPKKPIWIAEKYPSLGTVEDAITLAKYLGTAAQIGCQMVFRQVGPQLLKNPTPDYWFALLYKNLVGRGVFDAKITSGNKSEIVMFSHCSQSISPERSILDTGFNYDKGSVTVFGVNESPDTVKLTLKASMKDEKAHIYFLTFEEEPNGKTEKTFLNGQLLTSSPSGDLPIISPKIKRTIKYGITVPPRSIFFIVLPDLKSRTCTSPSPYLSPDVQSLSKKLIHVVADVLEKPSNDLKSEEEDPQSIYVKFSKSTGIQNLPVSDNKPSQVQEYSEPDVQVKYITFNDNSWLSKLTETMGNSKVYEQSEQNSSNGNSVDKYATLTAAITGSDNLTDIVLPDSESSIALPDSESSIVLPDSESGNHQKREKRSVHEQHSFHTDPSAESRKNSVASQEDLVKHLNDYASTVYKHSKGESNKEIEIKNIPPYIFNTLKEVKVTFKNLDKNSPKDDTDNTNGSPLFEKNEEDSKDTMPINSYIMSNDGTFDPMTLDSEKNAADSTIARDKELYNYKVETLRNNHRAPIDIVQKDIKNLDENYQESNDANNKKIDPVITTEPFQGKETYEGQIAKQRDLNNIPSETSDKSQERIEADVDEKFSDQEEYNPSESLASRQQKSGETDQLHSDKLKLDESVFSQNPESISETKESEANYIINNMPVVTAMNLDNEEEPQKNIILLPINSVEPAIPNSADGQDGTNEQPSAVTDYEDKISESNQDTNDLNEEAKFNKKQDNQLANGEDEKEKVISMADNIEKENLPSVNGIISEFYENNKDEKKMNNEDFIDGEELLAKSQDSFTGTKSSIYIPQQSSTEESKSSSLILPTTSENQGLEDGPPLPSYNTETVKVVQRAIPSDEGMSENRGESIPIVMVTNMEPEEQLQENNEEEPDYKITKPDENHKADIDGRDIPDIIPNRVSERNEKDTSNEDLMKDNTFSSSLSQTHEVPMKSSDTKVVSFADVPLENTVERSYGKTSHPKLKDKQNLLSSLENQIALENIKKDIQELEAMSNDSHEKRAVPETDETYSTEEIPMPVLLMSPEGEIQPLEKNIYEPDMEETMLPQIDTVPLKLSEITDEKADYSPPNERFHKNSPDIEEREEGNVDQYKLLEKSVPEQEDSNNKPDMVDKTEKSKADLEKERREKLLSLKKQIAEIREHFRAQVREEGLKAALQRREEEMRNYISQEKELKKKLFAYPLVNHDHNILSRPRRLSYFPEGEISDEEDCDYLDQKTYQRRTDSYGVPIFDDYEKSYLPRQVVSAPQRKSENNHILFPLDPKTPQALVYDDKIIPAKFFGVLSMNEQPSATKVSNIESSQILDLPGENPCQKCLIKQYDPHPIVKESYNPKISESSFEAYSLPKDSYIKSHDQQNYIPIVVLSTPIKSHRKRRSVANDNLNSKKLSKRSIKQGTDLKKRSIEQIPPYLDRSYDYLNEIPVEEHSHLNDINYVHHNDMTLDKNNDIIVNKFSKGYPELLPSNNLPTDYIQSRQNLFQGPPIWSDLKVTNDMESRHFLQPPHPPPLSHSIIPEEHSQEKDSPKFYFWSLMHNKFKSMLEMLQSLAEWCSSSSKK